MLKAFWEKNWTHVWGGLTSIGGFVIASAAPVLNNPEVKDYLHQMNLPLWAGLSLTIIGVITLVSMEHRNG